MPFLPCVIWKKSQKPLWKDRQKTYIHWPTLCPHLVGTKNAPSPHTCKWNFHSYLIEYRLFYGLLNLFDLFLLTTLQCLNKLSISLDCKHCEKQSQIIDVKLTKTSKMCHIISNNWCKTDKNIQNMSYNMSRHTTLHKSMSYTKLD